MSTDATSLDVVRAARQRAIACCIDLVALLDYVDSNTAEAVTQQLLTLNEQISERIRLDNGDAA